MDYIKYIEEHIQDKRHIVITGTFGSGKTTLVHAIRDIFDPEKRVPGIITWCEPGKAVYMRKVGEDEFVTIGEFDPHSLNKENSMKSVMDGFNVYGVSFLEELIEDKSEWVTIDEIGYLEGKCPSFLQKLDELFEQKRVVAVVRKQEIEHLNKIIQREDALVIDLDVIFK